MMAFRLFVFHVCTSYTTTGYHWWRNSNFVYRCFSDAWGATSVRNGRHWAKGNAFYTIIQIYFVINLAVFETVKLYQAAAPEFCCAGWLRQQGPLKCSYSSTKLTGVNVPEGGNCMVTAVRTSNDVFAQPFFLPLHFHFV